MARILSVSIDDSAQKWIRALDGLSEQRVKDEVVKPGFTKLGYMLTRSLSDEFSESKGVRYKGTMEAGFKSRDSFKATGSVLEIKDAARHGTFIREGVHGGFVGTFREALTSGKFPWPVVAWAEDTRKLGASRRLAMFIAYKIMTEGTGVSSKSVIRERWPSGERVFDYPEYVVEEKNRDDIDKIIQDMGQVGVPSLIHRLLG